ncbi:MAG: hypothetical protein WAW86_06995 [Gammaproteobacteria bacterium]
MDELLQHLELKLKGFVEQQAELKKTNKHLYQSKSMLTHEKELMLVKQQKAVTQIEALVSKLKAIENIS